jgi:large subunit ribosomal protein L4
MKLSVFDQKAKKIEDIEVDDKFFGGRVNNKVLSQYVYTYLSNQRQSNADTKDRSEVSGGGKKPWRQKGTGRARVGSSRSPLWRGGGVTFGVTNDKNYKKRMTKSFKKAAMRNVFTKLVKDENLNLVKDLKVDSKTKDALKIVKDFGNPKKLTVVTGEKRKELLTSFANVSNVNVVLISDLNGYDLLNGGKVLLETECLEYIKEKWSK